MIDEIEGLIQRYLRWLDDKTVVRQVADGWVAVTTPHLDRHNDYLEIYVSRRDGGFSLTDGGYIIEDLQQGGCSIDTPKRRELLHMTLAGFGVRNDGGQLMVDATPGNFAVRKHNLLQAMLAVNDLFYLAQPMVASLFYEDVVSWLDANGIRYVPNSKLTGKSGFDHHFDFVVPKSRTQPERMLQTINRPSRDTAEAAAFKWVDTREVRPPGSLAYAILNNQDQDAPMSVTDALSSYEVTPVLWTQRESVVEELAA